MFYNKFASKSRIMKLNERLLAKFATDYTTSDQEGFLLKKGEVNKGFQKRLFVLRGNLMFYFEKKQDREPIGVIILDNCRIELCPAENSLFAFQIVFEGVGTRTYVLAADTEECMRAWMKKLTHASHICLKTVVNDLEKRLADLKDKEASMTPTVEVFSQSSSDSEDIEDISTTSKDQPVLIALPKPPTKSLQRSKCKTLPPRRAPNKQAKTLLNNAGFNRWSLSTSYPTQTSLDGKKSLGFDDLIDLSERTDFLCEDVSQPGRHYSMAAFTPPSFAELKNHEEIEDQNLIDISPPDGGLPKEKKIDNMTLTDRFKGRRAKSERHRNRHGGLSGVRRDVGGSLHQKKRASDDLNFVEENHESAFQHLHRLWGATIWVKVREYEIQHNKSVMEGTS